MNALGYCVDGRCHAVSLLPPAEYVAITASVGQGGHNRPNDVKTIQDALNQVPPAAGGAQKPLATDGIAGPKTLSAIRRFQKDGCGFKWPDGRIDPGRRTHAELEKRYVPANPYVFPLMRMRLPLALHWVTRARTLLDGAKRHVNGQPGWQQPFDLANRWFKTGKLSGRDAKEQLLRIGAVFDAMQQCLTTPGPDAVPGSQYFREDPRENRHFAYTYAGGFTRRNRNGGVPTGWEVYPNNYKYPDIPANTIVICPRKMNQHSEEAYCVILVHELAHFCGPEGKMTTIEDFAYRRDKSVDKLTADRAARTADCYAAFAGEAALGREPLVI